MQHGRGSEIDGGTEWDVTEFAVLVYGMRISTALRTGYGNEDSDSYGAVTSYDDYCIDYEPKQ